MRTVTQIVARNSSAETQLQRRERRIFNRATAWPSLRRERTVINCVSRQFEEAVPNELCVDINLLLNI